MKLLPRALVTAMALFAAGWTSAAPPPPATQPPPPGATAPASATSPTPVPSSATEEGDPPPPSLVFRDVTATSGVDFRHPLSPEKKYILESVSGGVAVVDIDRDGRLDLYLVNSQTVASTRRGEAAPSALYRNETRPGGPLRFAERAVAAGVADTGWGVGVCAADVDGNGFPDLYVTGVGGNRLFLNRDGATFEDATDRARVRGGGWSTGCGFADADRDGDLDLFVARYLDMDLDNLPTFGRGTLCTYRGIPVQCGPRGLTGQSDLYFRNDGDGRFTEAGAAVGLDDPEARFGLGVVWLDADGDGWQDLYVAHDTSHNELYLNLRDGRFEAMGHLMGVAVSEDGKEQGSMGIAVGDYENTGWPALFVTNFSEEYNAFYRNHAGGYFSDVSFPTQTAAVSVRHVGWGTSFLDADNDGWLDLVLVNGHVYPQIDTIDLEASAPYRQRGMLFRNRGDGTFAEIVDPAGPLAQPAVSRGLAAGDLDGDGRLDLVINDLDGAARVLRNETPNPGHWLVVRLEGGGAMRDAVGATITVRIGTGPGAVRRTRTVRSGTGYLSQDALAQHIGLGDARRVDAVDVHWPDGTTSTTTDVAVDQVLVIRQGASGSSESQPE